MSQLSNNKGFTMIELLVVMVVAMILMALSTPFVTSMRSDLGIAQTLKQVKSDLVATMSYSLAGKSFASLNSPTGPSPDLMPSRYILFFEKDKAKDQPNDYYYIETTTQTVSATNQPTQSIYRIKKEMPNATVFLKDIRLKNSKNEIKSVDYVALFFTPPFGKILILDGSAYKDLITNDHFTFNLIDAFKSANLYEQVEFDFQFKDDFRSLTTISFDTNKIINVY